MREFRDYVKEKLKTPEEAVSYLNTALEEYGNDKDTDAFLLALRTVAEVRGGIGELAKKTQITNKDAPYYCPRILLLTNHFI
jgi:DNA-binding phage protein